MNGLQNILFLVAVIVGLIGLLAAIAAHFAFLRVLSSVHPELWQEWKSITFAFDYEMNRYQKLASRVYSRMTKPSAIRARGRDVLCTRAFAVCLILAVVAFAVSLFI